MTQQDQDQKTSSIWQSEPGLQFVRRRIAELNPALATILSDADEWGYLAEYENLARKLGEDGPALSLGTVRADGAIQAVIMVHDIDGKFPGQVIALQRLEDDGIPLSVYFRDHPAMCGRDDDFWRRNFPASEAQS